MLHCVLKLIANYASLLFGTEQVAEVGLLDFNH